MTASPRARREQVTLASAIEHALDEADEREFWRADDAVLFEAERILVAAARPMTGQRPDL